MDDAVGIAFTAGLPFVGLRDTAPDPTLLAGFPPGWLAARGLLPLSYADGLLTLASATPSPDLTGLDPTIPIRLVIAPAGEIAERLGAAEEPRGEGPPAVEEPRPEGPPAVAEPRPEAPPAVAEPRRKEPPPVAPHPSRESPPPREAAPPPPLPPVPEPERDALSAVPEHLQRRLWCLPVAVDDQHVHVAIGEALSDGARDVLRAAVAPRAARLVPVDPVALDARLVEVHGLRWVAAIRRGLPRAGKADAPERCEGRRPPRTTLLLPLPGGVGPAVQAATTLAALDHPADRLEVLLLVRAHDDHGARAARTTGHRVIVAPASLPQERLALLDLGLLLARGEHVAVLDPGDVPAARLLAHADVTLSRAGVAAVHAERPHQQPPEPPRRRGLRRASAPPLAPLPATGVVVRRDVLDALGGWRDLAAGLHAARLRVVALDDAVASATERS